MTVPMENASEIGRMVRVYGDGLNHFSGIRSFLICTWRAILTVAKRAELHGFHYGEAKQKLDVLMDDGRIQEKSCTDQRLSSTVWVLSSLPRLQPRQYR
jgi:hypothetical protein